ncbi:MAG: type III pantothenate kinase [Paludibacteraceae bacterium]|nr:type III pantothenate kinase [Prevotellaceae bacterium]
MCNLVIDQGNSSTKIGVFDKGVLLFSERYPMFGALEIASIWSRFEVEDSILSSVVDLDSELLSLLQAKSHRFVLLDESTPLPISNLYETPKTLGRDRLAVCVGANFLKPDSNLLVIDAGTAVTYDIVNSKNQYVGGTISPGLDMRARSLHNFTKKLPLVEVKEDVGIYGTTTETALQSGVLNGLVYEMDGYVNALSSVYPDLSVFLTGGSSFYFERKLKSVIFANQNLLLVGLNRILSFRC